MTANSRQRQDGNRYNIYKYSNFNDTVLASLPKVNNSGKWIILLIDKSCSEGIEENSSYAIFMRYFQHR